MREWYACIVFFGGMLGIGCACTYFVTKGYIRKKNIAKKGTAVKELLSNLKKVLYFTNWILNLIFCTRRQSFTRIWTKILYWMAEWYENNKNFNLYHCDRSNCDLFGCKYYVLHKWNTIFYILSIWYHSTNRVC